MHDSNPSAYKITYEEERGRIDAANNEALSKPIAKSALAHLPASGFSARAAVPALSMLWIPFTKSVDEVHTMIKKTMIMQLMLPTSTSFRVVGYWRGPTLFSTTAACR